MDSPGVGRAALEWALFLDAVAEVTEEKRAALIDAFAAVGIERLSNPLGTATLSRGKPTATVNERVLLAWVRERRPDMLVQRVNPAYIVALKRICEREGVCCDPDTGEVIPGVTLTDGAPVLRIVKDPEARVTARETVRRLAEGGLHQLEGNSS